MKQFIMVSSAMSACRAFSEKTGARITVSETVFAFWA